MKTFILTSLALLISLMTFAQSTPSDKGKWQIGAFGGISLPQGSYQDTLGRAHTGFLGGLFIDKYFSGNTFGLGIDARYLQHPSRSFDSVFFSNGYIAPVYHNQQAFKHLAVSIGPTYQFRKNNLGLELYARGGVLFQRFPQYEQILTYTDGSGTTHTTTILQTQNNNNRANAWMALGGLRFNYALTSQLDIFVQADYLTTIGNQFGGQSSAFHIEQHPAIQSLPNGPKEFMEDWQQYYMGEPIISKTFVQSVNIAAGIKYRLPSKAKSSQAPIQSTQSVVAEKNIQVVVKDEQTGLALSGVTVTIKNARDKRTSLTNSHGEAENFDHAPADHYLIQGEKNGIQTNQIQLSPDDFKINGSTLFVELRHNDPRFTLVGTTVECDTTTIISGINTTLTQNQTQDNMSQISDQEGKFIYQLDQHADYYVVANQAGKYSQTEQVSTRGLNRSKTLYVTLKLGVCDLQTGVNWIVKNIHYDFDKSHIRPDAALILNNIVSILKQNPSLRIELSSHTDSRGNDQYNMTLSQNRAQAAVDYLVSKGIDRSRLVAKGYGESRLLNNCGNAVNCSEAQHQENRRTEIKILQY